MSKQKSNPTEALIPLDPPAVYEGHRHCPRVGRQNGSVPTGRRILRIVRTLVQKRGNTIIPETNIEGFRVWYSYKAVLLETPG